MPHYEVRDGDSRVMTVLSRDLESAKMHVGQEMALCGVPDADRFGVTEVNKSKLDEDTYAQCDRYGSCWHVNSSDLVPCSPAP